MTDGLTYWRQAADGSPLPIRTNEVLTVPHDFADRLAEGEALESVGSAIETVRGTDATPNDIIGSNAPTRAGSVCMQIVEAINAVDGVTYRLTLIGGRTNGDILVQSYLLWVSDALEPVPPILLP